jgi:Protein of unknown function (DUF4007)
MVQAILRGSFSGHQTFTFRYPWLKKGVDALKSRPDIFSSEDAIVELGVGKNMVDSIRHWCLVTGVIEEVVEAGQRGIGFRVSEFGKKLLLDDRSWDPYLEDDATLWLLHWKVATNPEKATTWYVAFHGLRDAEFTRTSLLDEVLRIASGIGTGKGSHKTIENDVACFVRTYVAVKRGMTSTVEETLDCPLTQLGLIQTDEKGEHFRFNSRPKSSLPTAIFAYALAEFWERHRTTQNTLSLREIVHGEGSPGRAFRLDEDSVLFYLDGLSEVSNQVFKFEDTALVRQVVRTASTNPLSILQGYYKA